jgi:hypothetical protein
MAWESEPIKHLLEVTHMGDDGREFSDSQEFTPGKYSTDISLHLSKDDTELRVRPYTMEHLKQLMEEDYENGVVNELFVGIRDGTGIAYVGKFWTPKEFNGKRVNQYFFQNDEPSGFNLGHMSGPGWPINQPPVLDERLMQYFTSLKDVRPDVTGSLDRCMEHLTRAGPEYTGRSDGSISFKLARR